MPDPRAVAALNNAAWCAAVARTHGIDSVVGGTAWRSPGPTPPFYPEAVTLQPDAAPADVLPGHVWPGYSVKDSFATLDLAPYGFVKLFDASWIHRPAGVPVTAARTTERVTARDFRDWQVAWHGGDDVPDIFRPSLLDDPAVTVLAVEGIGGAVLNASANAVGVSNLFGADPPAVWAATIAAAGELHPGVDLVGYEQGDDLAPAIAAGFTAIGPLRVWLHE